MIKYWNYELDITRGECQKSLLYMVATYNCIGETL